MKIIYATGGSGSSFIGESFKKNGWSICLRPDGGDQKFNKSLEDIFIERTKKFFNFKLIDGKQYSQRELFDIAYPKLIEYENARKWRGKKLLLLSMRWGGLNFLNELKEKTIFLIRDPLYTFNSYSGGGWRKEGGKNRIKFVGAKGPNDKLWIDKFFGDFSNWGKGAENALKAYENGTGNIVRYNKFEEDWAKLEGVPSIHKDFICQDSKSKLSDHLNQETINYIKHKTGYIWNQINNLNF